MSMRIILRHSPIILANPVDKRFLVCYYMYMIRMMDKEKERFTIPPSLVKEAELMSQATRFTFRDCLELLVKLDNNLSVDNEDTVGREDHQDERSH